MTTTTMITGRKTSSSGNTHTSSIQLWYVKLAQVTLYRALEQKDRLQHQPLQGQVRALIQLQRMELADVLTNSTLFVYYCKTYDYRGGMTYTYTTTPATDKFRWYVGAKRGRAC